MIKIPEEILTVAELTEATGRKAQDIDIEITGLSVDRSSLVLSIDTKLNFVLPRNLESVMKERIRARLGSVHKIRINYMYSGIKAAPAPAEYDSGNQSNGYSGGYNGSNGGGGNGYRRKAKEEPAHENARGELILLGKDFTDVPTDYRELENYVGAKYKVCITNYCAKVPGSVFEGKKPLKEEKDAPIDNQAIIKVLRSRKSGGDVHIPTDNKPRGTVAKETEGN